MTLGIVRRGVVRLVPHCPSWSEDFVRERERLVAALGDRVSAIEHVGSTAIPGIYAKPVLDMAVAVADLDQALHFQGDDRLTHRRSADVVLQRQLAFGRQPRSHRIDTRGQRRDKFAREVLIETIVRDWARIRHLAFHWPDQYGLGWQAA